MGQPMSSRGVWSRFADLRVGTKIILTVAVIALVATPEQVQSLRELQATASVYNAYASETARQWSTSS